MSKIIKLYKNENTPYYVNADKIEYFYTNENGAVGVIFSETAVYFYAETEESIYLKINGNNNINTYDIGDKPCCFFYSCDGGEYITPLLSYEKSPMPKEMRNRLGKIDILYQKCEVEVIGIERIDQITGDSILWGKSIEQFDNGTKIIQPKNKYTAWSFSPNMSTDKSKDLYTYQYYVEILEML